MLDGSNDYYSKLNETICCQYISCLFPFSYVFFVSFHVFSCLYMAFRLVNTRLMSFRILLSLFLVFYVFSKRHPMVLNLTDEKTFYDAKGKKSTGISPTIDSATISATIKLS